MMLREPVPVLLLFFCIFILILGSLKFRPFFIVIDLIDLFIFFYSFGRFAITIFLMGMALIQVDTHKDTTHMEGLWATGGNVSLLRWGKKRGAGV
jgi:hypothetical protein